jgi:2-isopropylmalate synthase
MPKRKILLNDTALRDGAQVAGAKMPFEDQKTYVEYLIEGGIDIIEISFPGSSKEQFEECKTLVEHVKSLPGSNKPLLAGLARALEADILAVKNSGCDMCHIYIPASDSLMLVQFDSEKYGDTPEGKRNWMVSQAVEMVKFALELGFKQVQYSPEGATKTGREFLCRIVEAVIDAGVHSVNIPDTTGLCILNEFSDLIKHLFANVPNIHRARIACHCHNDSDNSTNNALQAILNGVDEVHGTFYGIGERSGMTKFESLLMCVKTREDIFNQIEIGFQIEHCVKVVNFIADSIGMPAPRHWPVIGSQNSICSSGTHQGIEEKAKKQGCGSGYYEWDPTLYGHKKIETVINSSSGTAGLEAKLKELNYTSLTRDQLRAVLEEVKKVSNAKNGALVTDAELIAIVENITAQIPFQIKVKRCQAIGGEGTIPTATVIIEIDKKLIQVAETGDGPYDAIMKAIKKAASKVYPEILKETDILLDDWCPVPVTKGEESLVDVKVRIKVKNGEDSLFEGRAIHLDTNQATAQAFANCLSWYLASLTK